ncbi:MAG: tetratricopeptide repeat protein [Cyanobacteria bacterium]|nr:tetratricopeptide repeat protein [Cyanobacteriota bacterium]
MFVFEWFKNRRRYAGFEAAMEKGDTAGALSALDEIIRSDPKSARPHLEKAHLYHYDEPEKALECYNRFIELDSQSADAFFGRGHIYFGFGEFEKALNDFSTAISIDPTHQSSYRNRGTCHANLKMPDKAFADYEKAVELNPADGLAFMCRAWGHYRATRYQEAVGDFTIAINLDDRIIAGCLQGRANAYEQLGKSDLAKQDRDKLQELGGELDDDFRDLSAELLHRAQMDKKLLSMKTFKKCNFDGLREVDHNIIVPVEYKDELISKLIELGIVIESVEDDEDGYLHVSCNEQIALKDISQRSKQLVRLVFDLNASYDGWGTLIPQECDEQA